MNFWLHLSCSQSDMPSQSMLTFVAPFMLRSLHRLPIVAHHLVPSITAGTDKSLFLS